jgi:putative ABC transport system permease protein
MFKNYLLTAYKVFMRRKLFTAINLACIVITLVILIVITALAEHALAPSGVEGKSPRFLQSIRLMATNDKHTGMLTSALGYKVIDKYLRPMKSVQTVAGVTMPAEVAVYHDGTVTNLMMRRADAEYWDILDFKVLSGRVPNKDDVARGRFVATINQSTANKLFPGATAVGRKMNVSGQQFEVIGVVEDELHINALSDIWVPVTTFPSTEYRDQISGEFAALMMGKSPADLAAIKKEVEEVAKTIQFNDPRFTAHEFNIAYVWADSKADLFARMLLNNDNLPDSGARYLFAILIGSMLVFMLLPALNLINLNTGRILERSSEIGVRKAFGATSAQLVWQLVLENVLLCLAGGAIGLLCAQGVLWWLQDLQLVPYLKVSINFAVFGYGLLITLVFGLLSGIIPAWKMSRLDPVSALKGAV